MPNKIFWLGILVAIFVFGIIMIACDDNSNTGNSDVTGNGDVEIGNPFVGTWKYSSSGVTTTITFYSNLDLTWVVSGSLITTSTSHGTYSLSGNTATLSVNGGTSIATFDGNSSFNMGGFIFTK